MSLQMQDSDKRCMTRLRRQSMVKYRNKSKSEMQSGATASKKVIG